MNLESLFRCLLTANTAHTTTRMSESSVLVIAHPGHELRAFTFAPTSTLGGRFD